MKIDM